MQWLESSWREQSLGSRAWGAREQHSWKEWREQGRLLRGEPREGMETASGGPGAPATECELKTVYCDHTHILEGLVSPVWRRTDGTGRGTLNQKLENELAISSETGGSREHKKAWMKAVVVEGAGGRGLNSRPLLQGQTTPSRFKNAHPWVDT